MLKVGDYVRVKNSLVHPDLPKNLMGATGIIVDCLVMDDGFPNFEVMLQDEISWFEDNELELVIND